MRISVRSCLSSGFSRLLSVGVVLVVGATLNTHALAQTTSAPKPPQKTVQKTVQKSSSGATVDGFSVYSRGGIRQGKSYAQIVELLSQNVRRCPQKLVPASHDSNIYVVIVCEKPEVYLSFCQDSLYWASITLNRGFHTFVQLMQTYSSKTRAGGRLKTSDSTATSRIRKGSKTLVDYEFSLQLLAPKYQVTLTLFGDPDDEKGVATDIRVDYQARINRKNCG